MNIYVSNLSFQVENEDLKGFFTPYGEVSSARIITDRESNRSRGFGFVEMPNDAEGENAIKKLNGAMVDGRAMNVTIARPKENSGNNSRGGFKKDNFWK
jgi:RNA recognition motif-containing protein